MSKFISFFEDSYNSLIRGLNDDELITMSDEQITRFVENNKIIELGQTGKLRAKGFETPVLVHGSSGVEPGSTEVNVTGYTYKFKIETEEDAVRSYVFDQIKANSGESCKNWQLDGEVFSFQLIPYPPKYNALKDQQEWVIGKAIKAKNALKEIIEIFNQQIAPYYLFLAKQLKSRRDDLIEKEQRDRSMDV